MADFEEKVVVISGATSGIGQRAAARLASLGARIVLIARNPERADRTISLLDAASPGGQRHRAYLADLSLIGDTVRVANEVVADERRIDILVNNAGGLYFSREITAEGLERTFALNHMSYFLMAEGLGRSLVPGSRVVNTASEAHRGAPSTLDDLPNLAEGGFRAYARTKAFNILFTRALADRLLDSGVGVYCHHPGFVPTRLFGERGWRARGLGALAHLIGVSVEKGADTLVYLASTGDRIETGNYYSKRRKRDTTAFTRDMEAADRLWRISEEIRDRYAPAAR